MESTEPMEIRTRMVSMHDFFLERIRQAEDQESYIEASWLIYSCLENRYFRTIQKFKASCKYSGGKCSKPKNELALRTKIRCIERLHDAGVSCIVKSFDKQLLAETLTWIKKRNDLMHNLLKLDTYQTDYDGAFRELTSMGHPLLDKTYQACTVFRELYYSDGYRFEFPEACMERCPCKPRQPNVNA